MNHYGPTETTIGTVTKLITKQELGALNDRSMIGRPITHTRALVLNRQRPRPLWRTWESFIYRGKAYREDI
ncbi:hypothetical protein ACEQPO_02315 [Bacillus sp. SL00103]